MQGPPSHKLRRVMLLLHVFRLWMPRKTGTGAFDSSHPPLQGRMVDEAGAAEEAELAGRMRPEVDRQSGLLRGPILHQPPGAATRVL